MKRNERLCSQPHHDKEKKKNLCCETCQLLSYRVCTLVLHKDHRIADMCNNAKVHRDAMNKAVWPTNQVSSNSLMRYYGVHVCGGCGHGCCILFVGHCVHVYSVCVYL